MDPDRPTSSYRTPAAEAAAPPCEVLTASTVPILGALRLELGLGAPIRLSLDREELRLTPGSGLHLRSDGLPPLHLRHLRQDLSTAELEIDATGLAGFEARAASVALAAAFTHVLDWQPGRSLVDLALQNLPTRHDDRRRVFARGPLAVWLDPATRLDLTLSPEQLELSLSDAVHLRILGIGIGLLAARYLFASQRIELEGPAHQPLRNALLRLLAWFASRWLRARLPPALASAGYDPFADPARRAHFTELALRLGARPAPKASQPVPSATHPAPAPSDSQPAPSDSQPVPSDSQPVPSATRSAPVPSDSQPVPSDTHMGRLTTRLRELKQLRLGPGALPPGTRLVLLIPLGAHGSLALCTGDTADLTLHRRRAALTLAAPGGLFVRAEQLPGLERLQLDHLEIDLVTGALAPRTTPALGSFTAAVLAQLARKLLTRLSPAAHARVLALIHSDELLRHPAHGAPTLTLTTPRDREIVLRHSPAALSLEIPAGLTLAFPGIEILPDAQIHGLRYIFATGALELDATPAVGDFGNNLLTQVFRHRGVPHLPALLGFKGPDASPPHDPTIAGTHSAVVFARRFGVIGPLLVAQDPADRITLALSADALDLTSAAGVALLAPELQVTLLVQHLRFAPGHGLTGAPNLGAYLTTILTRLLERSALAPLRRRLPDFGRTANLTHPWQLLRADAGPLGPIALSLAPAGAIVLERSSDGLELRFDPFLEIRPERPDYLPVIAFRRLRWSPGTDAWTLEFEPAVGPLVGELVQHLVHRLAPPDLLAQITRYLALPAPIRGATPTPPPVPGTIVYERKIPNLGNLRIAADPRHAVDLELTRKAVDITLGKPIAAHLPGFDIHLDGLRVGLRPLSADLQTRPPAGPLFDRIVEQSLRGLLKHHADAFWPSGDPARIGQDTLLVLGRDAAWGPLRISVPSDGGIGLHLDRDGLTLRSQAGIFISGAAIDWLPDFYLHALAYTFETGAVGLEISGIDELYYHEKHPVSPVTLALLAHLIKVLALPKAPAWSARLGLRQFPLPPVPAVDRTRIGMARIKLPGDFGDLHISMPPDDTVTIRIDTEEASIISERGLFATLPGLRFELSLRGIRYHLQSGEIQVGGLGQLENALLEAIVARRLKAVPQIGGELGGETPGDQRSALHTLLEQLPVDAQGRRLLFAHKLVNIRLPADACLIMRLRADALSFTADPAIKIDGPARIDYSFNGIRYEFADAAFHLDLDNDGALLSGLLTDVVIHQVEKRLDTMLKPLLPAALRTPGYNLANDPNSEQHISELIASFSALANKKK